jgi:hypothetical protein
MLQHEWTEPRHWPARPGHSLQAWIPYLHEWPGWEFWGRFFLCKIPFSLALGVAAWLTLDQSCLSFLAGVDILRRPYLFYSSGSGLVSPISGLKVLALVTRPYMSTELWPTASAATSWGSQTTMSLAICPWQSDLTSQEVPTFLIFATASHSEPSRESQIQSYHTGCLFLVSPEPTAQEDTPGHPGRTPDVTPFPTSLPALHLCQAQATVLALESSEYTVLWLLIWVVCVHFHHDKHCILRVWWLTSK